MLKGPEAQTQALILEWLAVKHILAFRQNTGAVISEYRGKKRMIRYGVSGMADILCFPHFSAGVLYHQPLWIEVKAPKGKQSELQKSFQKQVEEHGHKYIVAHDLQDVIDQIS